MTTPVAPFHPESQFRGKLRGQARHSLGLDLEEAELARGKAHLSCTVRPVPSHQATADIQKYPDLLRLARPEILQRLKAHCTQHPAFHRALELRPLDWPPATALPGVVPNL